VGSVGRSVGYEHMVVYGDFEKHSHLISTPKFVQVHTVDFPHTSHT